MGCICQGLHGCIERWEGEWEGQAACVECRDEWGEVLVCVCLVFGFLGFWGSS